MSGSAEGQLAERLWTSIVAQEGAALDPGRSIGRHGPRDAAARAPVAIGELPRVGAADVDVLEPIGKGGMGQVELVRQRCLQREVALKRLRVDLRPDPADAQALVREALHAGALEHPNIVPVYLLGRDEQDLPVLLMKRVSGTEWLSLIEDPDHPRWAELPADRVAFHLDVLRQVCNAVHYAHSRGLLHRDVKPANVMLGRYGEVYLLDWGLSVALDEPRPPSTSPRRWST
jgi:serine/threonine-protein kinase